MMGPNDLGGWTNLPQICQQYLQQGVPPVPVVALQDLVPPEPLHEPCKERVGQYGWAIAPISHTPIKMVRHHLGGGLPPPRQEDGLRQVIHGPAAVLLLLLRLLLTRW